MITMTFVERYRRQLILSAAICLLGLASQGTWAQESCGSLIGDGLNVDYTDPAQAPMIATINRNHFNEGVETLVRGQSATIEGDLDFILRNSPNHHRALYAMARYHLREGTEKFKIERYSIRCWFDRAMRFAPSDGAVRVIYGIYLHQRREYPEAEQRYKEGLELSPGFAEGHYNLGLLYVETRRYDEALVHAHEAYRLGYPLQGLKGKLTDAGRWRDLAR
jgi:Tfp pilus assembly protein PilF